MSGGLSPHRRTCLALLLLAVTSTLAAHRCDAATLIPTGVQTDVDYSTVTTTWGWTVAYEGDYLDTITIANLFAGLKPTDYVMLAAIHQGDTKFTVLAAATLADVETHTALNQTHAANGVAWYFNADSMGFAPAGGAIVQDPTDTASPDDPKRLSWWTYYGDGLNDASQAPTAIQAGYRAGIAANDYTDGWDRVVLTPTTADPNSPGGGRLVPLPPAATAGLILLFLPALQRRRSRASIVRV